MTNKGPRHSLAKVEALLPELEARLRPYTVDYMVVGSVGRKEPLVGDLDILIYPKKENHSGIGTYPIPKIQRELQAIGTWHKGGTRAMSVRNILGTNISLDLFLCHPPAQWGILVGSRLNPAEFVVWAKAKFDDLYIRENGTLFDYKTGVEIKVPDEKTYFKLLGVEWCPPTQRRELCERMGLEPI